MPEERINPKEQDCENHSRVRDPIRGVNNMSKVMAANPYNRR